MATAGAPNDGILVEDVVLAAAAADVVHLGATMLILLILSVELPSTHLHLRVVRARYLHYYRLICWNGIKLKL